MDDTPPNTPGRPRARIKTMDAAAAFVKSKSAEVLAAKIAKLGAAEAAITTDSQVGDVPVTGKLSRRSKPRKEAHGLMPLHHPNRDFFLCDMFDYALKDDGVSMEAPIFSLSTKADTSIWHWESKDSLRAITVTPSVKGRATQFDKDLLIYVVSQMTEALNRERLDAQTRVVRFRVYDYLVSTNKPTGGKEYQRLQDALERLTGTRIKTNIKTGGVRVKEMFGLIESATIVEKALDDESMIAVEVTLSKWLFNAVQAHEVLTINPDYFRLRKPIERRLYELARKHCGDQARFVIGVELLQDKCGSQSSLKEFRRALREVIEADTLPDYKLAIDNDKSQVVICMRDAKKLALNMAMKISTRGVLAQ
jgi:plasmid replication initiation protein